MHKSTYKALRELFPLALIHQEYPIKIGRKTLYIDLLIHSPLRLAIECHGRQHFEHISHFHDSLMAFRRQQRLDAEKAYWCEQNGYLYVVTTYKDKEVTPELLKERIEEALEYR